MAFIFQRSAFILGIVAVLSSSTIAQTQRKSFGDIQVEWAKDNQGDYVFKFYDSKESLIFDFNTKLITQSPDFIEDDDVVLHTNKEGDSRFVGVHGIGMRSNIYLIFHLSESGEGEWKVDDSFAENLGKYGCGGGVLDSRLTFDDGVGTLRFWSGKESKSPCLLTFRFKGTSIVLDGRIPSPNVAELKAAVQKIHREVIGRIGGPQYVAVAVGMLVDNKSLMDVRGWLVGYAGEASVQQVHRDIVGAEGGGLYVDKALGMLKEGRSIHDVRTFLVNTYGEESIIKVYRLVKGVGTPDAATLSQAMEILRSGKTLDEVRMLFVQQ